MEKIWKFVESGEDVSRAVEYCEKMGLYFKGFEKGSLLFKMQINTLGDLERLRKLVTYGGMKKVLDQELVDKRMEVSYSKYGSGYTHKLHRNLFYKTVHYKTVQI